MWPAGIAALTLHAAEDGESWCIADSAGSTLAVARSDAGHPNTVDPAEWRLRGGGLDAEYLRHEAFSLQTEGPNTEAEPFLLEELGRDYFVRVQLKSRRILWFVDPGTGGTCHTAAKSTASRAGGRTVPGRRFCPLCSKCISANNFQSQHILQVHRPGRTTGLTILAGPGGSDASLSWEPPSSDGGFKIVAYRVAVSADGGASWATLRDVPTHELSPSTLLPGQLCATVSLEQQHLPCASALGLGPSAPLLSVAALNRAGAGPASCAERVAATGGLAGFLPGGGVGFGGFGGAPGFAPPPGMVDGVGGMRPIGAADLVAAGSLDPQLMASFRTAIGAEYETAVRPPSSSLQPPAASAAVPAPTFYCSASGSPGRGSAPAPAAAPAAAADVKPKRRRSSLSEATLQALAKMTRSLSIEVPGPSGWGVPDRLAACFFAGSRAGSSDGKGAAAPAPAAGEDVTFDLDELSAMVDSAEGGGEPSLSPSDLSAARSDLSPLSATRTDLAFSDSDEAESGRLPADDEMPPAFCLADLVSLIEGHSRWRRLEPFARAVGALRCAARRGARADAAAAP